MADKATLTTESLRETLFTVMDRVMSGSLDAREAKAVVDAAGRIIDSADLEIRIAEFYSRQDARDSGLVVGRHLLVSRDT